MMIQMNKNMTGALLAFAAVLAMPAMAQSRTRGMDRSDFDTYMESSQRQGAPGVKVQIELQRDGKRRIAAPNEAFYSGDKVRFLITTNFDARLVVVNQEKDAEAPVMLFPMDGDDDQVKGGKVYTTPGFQFDDNPGIESVMLILTDLRNSSDAEVAFESATKSRSAWKAKGRGVVAAAKARSLTRTRGLVRADNEDDMMVLASERDVFSEPTAVIFSLQHKARR